MCGDLTGYDFKKKLHFNLMAFFIVQQMVMYHKLYFIHTKSIQYYMFIVWATYKCDELETVQFHTSVFKFMYTIHTYVVNMKNKL